MPTRPRRVLLAAGALALTGLLLPVVPGQAAQARSYTLVLSPGETLVPDHSRAVTLSCSPPGGSHPRREEACALFQRYHDDLDSMDESRDTICTREYAPVTVAAERDGGRVYGPRTYGNACLLRASKGAVFDF